MSWQEVRDRVRAAAYMKAQQAGWFTVEHPPEPDLSIEGHAALAGTSGVEKARYRRGADRILEGRLDLFTLKDLDYGRVPVWNRNARSGQVVPLSFGKTLDYRDVSRIGDIKYIWIPNRHDHLVTVAQAYHLTRDERYLRFIEEQITSWIEQCPYLKGPNWTSSLELAIRLINWSFIWHLVGGVTSDLFVGDRGQQFRGRWLKVIYQHMDFIRGHFSRNSSANNHLIGEASGLFVACHYWPFWEKAVEWRTLARRILEREIVAQTHADGVNKEQTLFYQQFVLNFFLVADLAARAAGEPFSRTYGELMEKMLEFLASMMDVAGNMPMIGDGDDGYILRLSREDSFCHYRSLLATGAVLYRRPEFKAKAGELDDKSRWLLGDTAPAAYEGLAVENPVLPVRRAFPEGGYYLLGTDFETEEEIRLLVDAGPLGYTSIAAHGHADALSILLNVGGREFLVDPGTFSYQSEVKWRNYFRGTSAHNTVRIDGQDQSVIGGKFMWHHKANAGCREWESGPREDRFDGYQDGYRRLADPVLHRRRIRFDKERRVFHLEDAIECDGAHLVELFWHFSERCRVRVSGTEISAEQDGIRVSLEMMDSGWEIGVRSGEESPPCGWISRSFNVKEPTTTVVCHRRIDGGASFRTEIKVVLGDESE